MPSPEQPFIYQLKVVLLDITPMICPRLLLHSDSTIAELHHTMQIVMGGQIPIYIASLSTVYGVKKSKWSPGCDRNSSGEPCIFILPFSSSTIQSARSITLGRWLMRIVVLPCL